MVIKKIKLHNPFKTRVMNKKIVGAFWNETKLANERILRAIFALEKKPKNAVACPWGPEEEIENNNS